MKRINNLYQKLLNKDYIKQTIITASKGKTKRREVRSVLADIDYYVNDVYEMLYSGKIVIGRTHNRTIKEKGKERLLTISPFYPNRVLDYLMVETLKPYIRKSMYQYCIGNVDGRGMIYGKKVIARKLKKYKYYVKLDIHHFYPSVSSERLIDFICGKIKDKRFIDLCRLLILSETCLPIGSYYSQWFSNWYLEDVDRFIKEELKVPFYIRYVDDMVLFGNNKKKLRSAMYNIQRKLQSKGLRLKRYEQVRTFENQPLDFIGFRFYPDSIVLRMRNIKIINKRIAKIRKTNHVCFGQAKCILSYYGWLKQANGGYMFYKTKIKPLTTMNNLKQIVSKNDKAKKKGVVR